MSSTAISVENISKVYRLGQIGGATLKEDFARWWAKMSGKPDPLLKIGEEHHARQIGEEFWALQNVSFNVREGEVLGVIGRNGAGKSTLLKILSQVTAPTSGEIKIKGRIASLLEVGTGFHQELTGRENIFLNGAILGMSKAEIRRKLDEIIDFSGIEQFIDTPVKRYSSGMFVRLAFAVAAHLEPEILIVDEVLAVGDADFQKKCMGKMQNVSKGGKTILFVSHNMAAISKLCQHCALFDGGRLKLLGSTEEVVPHYLKSGEQANGVRVWRDTDVKSSDPRLKIHSLRILAPNGTLTGRIDIEKPLTIEIEYDIIETFPQFRIGLWVIAPDGAIAFSTADSFDPSYDEGPRNAGLYISRCVIPENLLNEGFYNLTLTADIPHKKVLFYEESVLGFFVEQTGGLAARFPDKWPGAVRPHLNWQTQPVKSTRKCL
jgi:lipopolysaccharide transport system ATP-binding protein